jgi:hypothetical protein
METFYDAIKVNDLKNGPAILADRQNLAKRG